MMKKRVPPFGGYHAWFAQRGVTGCYHTGGNVVLEEDKILDWFLSHSKTAEHESSVKPLTMFFFAFSTSLICQEEFYIFADFF